MKQLRVMLADDHAVLRAGLKLVVEREPDMVVVAEAVDGRQAVDLAPDGNSKCHAAHGCGSDHSQRSNSAARRKNCGGGGSVWR